MIEPQVLHGGASSWFRIAANSLVLGAGGPEGPPLRTSGSATDDEAEAAGATVTLGVATPARPAPPNPPASPALVPPPASLGSSRMFTPARYWASCDRNLVAIQRKM